MSNELDTLSERQRASFVTLHLDDELNDCIDRLLLHHDIAHNASHAAFQNHRFRQVTSGDLDPPEDFRTSEWRTPIDISDLQGG